MRAATLLVVLAAVVAGVIWWRTASPPSTTRGPEVPSQAGDNARVDAATADASSEPHAPPPDVRGQALTIARMVPTALRYSTRVPAAVPVDDPVRPLLAAASSALGLEVRFDQPLTSAAREVAVLASRLAQIPPEPALSYLLHSSGAPDGGVAVHMTQADPADAKALQTTIRAALATAPSGHGPVRVGVGEAATDGALARTIVVLVARLDVELDDVPTTALAGERWQLRFTPLAGWHDLDALMLAPGGDLTPVTLTSDGADQLLEVAISARATVGDAIQIGIDGTGPDGPGKLVQLTVWVGARPPSTTTVAVDAADPVDLAGAGAETFAFELLDDDRARAGGDRVTWDPALAAIARAHSQDMRDAGYFGHQSPRTGLAGDRLAAAGYRGMAYGENLARNDTLAEAEASLLGSLGHRANILNPSFTHAGVGVARGSDGSWFVTQLFARPAPVLTNDSARAVAARIDRVRAAQRLPALRWRDALVAVAQRGAAMFGAASIDEVIGTVKTALRPVTQAAASIWAATGIEPDEFELPAAALAADARDVGVALWQDVKVGTVGLVLVIGQ